MSLADNETTSAYTKPIHNMSIDAAPAIAVPFSKDKRFIDRTGQKHGRWTVINYAGHKTGRSMWFCICLCGTRRVVYANHMSSGRSRSCGCLEVEMSRSRFTTHGMSKTRPFRIWKQMIQRVTNPNNAAFPAYGGRGIKICERWLRSFELFWRDMQDGYSDKLTIERRDNSSDYSPENCRWATYKEQANNTRRNHLLTFDGRTMTITQWEKAQGFSDGVLRGRLHHGWTIIRALTQPARGASKRKADCPDKALT